MEHGADRDTVQRLAALLAGDKARRGAALAELSALAAGAGGAARNASQEAAVGVAAACVAPLVAMLCEDISRVDPGEAQEVSLVLASLMQLDPLLVAQEYIREGRLLKLCTTKGSAFDVLFAKTPSELSRDDVLLAACHMLPMAIIFSQGSTRVMVASGETENDLEYWGRIFPVLPWHLVRAPTHERNRKLVLLALDVLRNPQGVSQIEVAGMWKFVFIATSGRYVPQSARLPHRCVDTYPQTDFQVLQLKVMVWLDCAQPRVVRRGSQCGFMGARDGVASRDPGSGADRLADSGRDTRGQHSYHFSEHLRTPAGHRSHQATDRHRDN